MSAAAQRKSGFERDPADGEQLAAFAGDATTQQVIEEVARRHWPATTVHLGGLDAAINNLAAGASSKLLIVDLGDNDDPLPALTRLADHCEPGTEVIALGTVNEVELFRQLLTLGVADYLVKPLVPEVLEEALLAAATRPSAVMPTEEQPGEVVLVIGARGGAGATTLAVNAAWLTADEKTKRTALVDLDLQFGTAALALDLVPVGGLAEVMRYPERLDRLFLASATLSKGDRLSVLASEDDLSREPGFGRGAVSNLLEQLRGNHDVVWVDLPRHLMNGHEDALQHATRVIVVSDLSLAGMRDTLRLMVHCRQAVPEVSISVVLNRVAKRGGLTVKQFEKGIESKVAFTLPEDAAHTTTAAVDGKPVAETAKRAPLVAAMRALVTDVVGAEPKKKSGSLFSLRLKKAA